MNFIQDMNYLIKRFRTYDPATQSSLEVFFLYPGFRAMFFHRIAHALYRAKIPFIPRLISEVSRFFNGIDIHPGATIGKGFIMDHGLGTAIGETAIIGDDVTTLPGVILGAVQFERKKRHPTIESGAFIGTGSKVLGNITVGKNARVGANSVVLSSVPEGMTVVGAPACPVESSNRHYIRKESDQNTRAPNTHLAA